MHGFNMPVTVQIDCLKTVEGVGYTKFHSVIARNCKISKSKNAVILSKMIFFPLKREVHIFNMPVTFV